MLGTLPFLIVAAVVEATATRKFVKTERNAAESAEKVYNLFLILNDFL